MEDTEEIRSSKGKRGWGGCMYRLTETKATWIGTIWATRSGERVGHMPIPKPEALAN